MEFDFSKNETVENLDTVPEQFKNVYTKDETTGHFKVADSFKTLVNAVAGLNGALKKERSLTSTLKSQKDISSQLKETLGFESLDEAKTKFDEMVTLINERSKVDPKKIKEDIEKTFNSERENLKQLNNRMRLALENHLIDATASSALAENKGNIKLLMPLLKSQAVVIEENGNFEVRIKDPSGDYRGNGAGGFMTISDLVKEMKASPDYGVAFASESPSGNGRPGGPSGSSPVLSKTEDTSSVGKISRGLLLQKQKR